MDYIQEELLRQRKILSVLMTGGQWEQAEEPGRGEEEQPLGQQAADSQEERRRSTRESAEALLRRHSRSESFGNLPGEIRMSGVRSDGETVQRGPGMLVTEGPAVEPRIALYDRTVAEGTAGARELSRSIQRDARRYDGGFSIY